MIPRNMEFSLTFKLLKRYFPTLSVEGSSISIAPSSTLLKMLVCEPRSRKVKYLESIPDPVEIKKIIITIRKI